MRGTVVRRASTAAILFRPIIGAIQYLYGHRTPVAVYGYNPSERIFVGTDAAGKDDQQDCQNDGDKSHGFRYSLCGVRIRADYISINIPCFFLFENQQSKYMPRLMFDKCVEPVYYHKNPSARVTEGRWSGDRV
jgi:hypothetical protein